MNRETERDRHFFESAKLLVARLEREGFITPVRGAYPYTLVSQFAYDLVAHTIDALWPYINDKAIDPSPADIPDLDAWPTTAD